MSARSQLLTHLAENIQTAVTARPALIAIDGVDAAGKTTLSADLAAVLEGRGEAVVCVSVDGFHNPAATRYARIDEDPAVSYYEDSFDYDALRRHVLEPLRGPSPRLITPALFDHTRDASVTAAPVPVENAIVLVDGIFMGRHELAGAWDYWIYLRVDAEVARARGVARDQVLYGEATEERYRSRFEGGQALYHDAVDPIANADVVIDNTNPDMPEFVR